MNATETITTASGIYVVEHLDDHQAIVRGPALPVTPPFDTREIDPRAVVRVLDDQACGRPVWEVRA